ncbi:hypothetical protein MRX96_009431 [Rhipicephalus microplus]
MPSIVLFRRRWIIADDDLYLPPLLEAVCRLGWLVASGLLLWEHRPLWMCGDSDWLAFAYQLGAQVFCLLVIGSDLALAAINGRGAIIASSTRRAQVPILYVRSFMLLAEVAWHALGTAKVFFYGDPCVPLDLWRQLETLVIVAWGIVIMLLLCVYALYDPAGSIKHNPFRDIGDVEASRDVKKFFLRPSDKGHRRRTRLWFARLRRFFCCASDTEDSPQAYEHMAEYAAYLFEDVDITPSDMFSALVLLRKKQRRQLARMGSTSEESREGMTVPYYVTDPSFTAPVDKAPRSNGVSPGATATPAAWPVAGVTSTGPHPWMNPEQALYYLKFAWGIYGWPAYMASHVLTGLCDLWGGIRCCTCLRGGSGNVSGDNCCECHAATVKHLTRVRPEDLLFSSFANGLYRVPFYVALDHRTNAILVVARGTLSVADALTDSVTAAAKMPDGVGLCHQGVLQSALQILGQLDEPLAQAMARHPKYTLVLTGHSLGAAVASVLGILLRPRFPSLRCYAFSPPGGILDVERARETRDFVMTIVVGDDLVCRLGFTQVNKFKRDVVSSLLQCDMNKNVLNRHGLEALFCCRRLTPPLKDKEAFEKINAPNGKLAEGLRPRDKPTVALNYQRRGSCHLPTACTGLESNRRLSTSSWTREFPPIEWPEMHMPGKILHFIREGKRAEYQMFWTSPEYFDHLVVSPRCFKDHMPDVVYDALRSVCTVTAL